MKTASPSELSDVFPAQSIRRLMSLASDRIAIESISPMIDGGRFPAKTTQGERFTIEADIFGDGHDMLGAAVLWRRKDETDWREARLAPLGNDRWAADVVFSAAGDHEYTVCAWRDLFATWQRDTEKKLTAGQDVSLELSEGLALVRRARESAESNGLATLEALDEKLAGLSQERGDEAVLTFLLGLECGEMLGTFGPRTNLSRYRDVLTVWVERPLAAFSAWYELMPRSQGRAGASRYVPGRDRPAAICQKPGFRHPIFPAHSSDR